MPEQLLGRIIRTCSNADDVVIDPFSGSSTTLAVAKKLGRQYFGFELSKEYVRLGMERLERIAVGDKLNGAEEPSMSALAKKEEGQKKKTAATTQAFLFPKEEEIHTALDSEIKGIAEAFVDTHKGYSLDRLVADPVLNEDFQIACNRRSIPGTEAERNRFLFRIRKSGKFKALGVKTSVLTKIDWKHISPFVFASEIAWRQISNKYCMSLDEMFCDPRIAVQFDEVAADFAPGFHPIDYRWAALKLRKDGCEGPRRAALQTPKQLGISQLNKKGLASKEPVLVSNLDLGSISTGAGVYVIRELDGSALYAGETNQLATRLATTFDPSGPRSRWLRRSGDLEIFMLPIPEIPPNQRFARQSVMLGWHKPEWNFVQELAS